MFWVVKLRLIREKCSDTTSPLCFAEKVVFCGFYLQITHAAERASEQAPESDDEGDFLTLATASRQASLRTKAACEQLANSLLSVRVPIHGLN